MKISVLQPDTVWQDKKRNFTILEQLIDPLAGKTDIIVLPEMFNTGFTMDVQKSGEPAEGDTLNWMKEEAQRCSCGICGSYIVKVDDRFFNRLVFVSPDSYCYYDKRHLFSMAGENISFSKGNSRLIFNFRGFRISPYICYDLRFPVWSRSRNEYDLAIYVANWPDTRISVWSTLLKSRAIENQCYVAGSNRVGTDGSGLKYPGNSTIINPRGELLAEAQSNECSITAELSMTELTDFREKFPVFNDADEFQIKM